MESGAQLSWVERKNEWINVWRGIRVKSEFEFAFFLLISFGLRKSFNFPLSHFSYTSQIIFFNIFKLFHIATIIIIIDTTIPSPSRTSPSSSQTNRKISFLSVYSAAATFVVVKKWISSFVCFFENKKK